MFRRFFFFLSAIVVCASSAFAWSSESFLADGSAYELAPVSETPVAMYSAVSPLSDVDSSEPVDLLTRSDFSYNLTFAYRRQISYELTVGSVTQPITYPQVISSVSATQAPNVLSFPLNFEAVQEGNSMSPVEYGPLVLHEGRFSFTYPVSGDSDTVEISCSLSPYFNSYNSYDPNYYGLFNTGDVSVSVNNQVVASGEKRLKYGSLIYTSTEPITSITISAQFPSGRQLSSGEFPGTISMQTWMGFYDSYCKVSFFLVMRF